MTTATTGIGTITLGQALPGMQTFDLAGAAGMRCLYLIIDGLAWEKGYGDYASAGTTLSRNLLSSSTGSLLNLSGAAIVLNDASNLGVAPNNCLILPEVETSGSQSSVTFSNIPQCYRHLELRVCGRGDTAAVSAALQLQFNGDTGNNYDWSKENRFGNSFQNSVSAAQMGDIPAASVTANYSSGLSIDIFNYRGTTFYKNMRAYYEFFQTSGFYELNGGQWRSTAAITSMKVFLSAGNFLDHTIIGLYGRN